MADDQEELKFKKGHPFMLGSTELLADIKYWIPSGCWSLDAIIGGGIPGGRLIEIYGDESTGKTLVALNIIRQVQEMGGRALLLDPEMTTSRDFLAMQGVNVNELYVAYPSTIEEVYDYIIQFLEAMKDLDLERGETIPAVIVWDSIASTPSLGEVESVASDGLEKANIGGQARALSKMLRLLPRKLSRSGVTGVFINQTRQKIGVLFGDNTAVSGGKSLAFYASVRLRLKNVRTYRENKEVLGIEIRSTVMKNKVDRPFGVCRFPIIFNAGIDNAVSVFWYLKDDLKVITTTGGWQNIELGGESVRFRTTEWRSLFEEHQEEIYRLIMQSTVPRIDEKEEKEELGDE